MANLPAKQIDPWKTDKEGWEYIAIPEENALGERHASIGLNRNSFEAGQTYLVPPPVATFIKERLKVYNRACIRQLQPNRDIAAENAVAVGTSNSKTATAVDPNSIG